MSEKPTFPMIWPSLIVVALGIYSYFTLQPPLDTARPDPKATPGFPSPPTPPGLHAYDARLWEDPLAVVHESRPQSSRVSLDEIRSYVRSAVSKAYPEKLHRELRDSSNGNNAEVNRNLVVLPVMVPGGKYGEDRERRMRMRYAVVSALSICNYHPKFAGRLSAVSMPLYVDGAATNRSFKEYLTIPVEFYLDFPDRGLLTDNHSVDEVCPHAVDAADCDCESGRRPQGRGKVRLPKVPVLVCWIDESRLGGRPLAVLAQVLDHLLRRDGRPQKLMTAARQSSVGNIDWNVLLEQLGQVHSISERLMAIVQKEWTSLNQLHAPLAAEVCILGPASSDTLFRMAYENDNPQFFFGKNSANRNPDPYYASRENRPLPCGYFAGHDYFVKPVQMLSARATIPEEFTRNSDPPNTEAALQNFTSGKPTSSGLQVSRIIGSDSSLAKAIKTELQLRDAWGNEESGLDECHVALIAERDTQYGRAIVHAFNVAFQTKHSEELSYRRERPDFDPYISTVAYLRGIDGEMHHGEEKSSSDKRSDSRDHDASVRVVTDEVEPEGEPQKDYLLRIQQQLQALDNQLREEGGRGITAIGVVGSDVFDKLLILRSLKKRFRYAQFFTTDLDANFWRKTEYDTTRNLIVASHFGLQLHPDLQRDVPPFRDSYQTSLFLATLVAGRDRRTMDLLKSRHECDGHYSIWTSSDASAPLNPLIFEIGKHGPYQLTTTGGRRGLVPHLTETWVSESQLRSGDSAPDLTAQLHPTSPRERPNSGRTLAKTFKRIGAAAFLVLVLTAASMSLLNFFMPVFQKLRDYIVRLWRDYLQFVSDLLQRLGYSVVVPERTANDENSETRDKRGGFLVRAVVVVCVVVAVGLMVLLIHRDHRTPSGEPFSLMEGISIWPSVILNLIAATIGVVAVFDCKRRMKGNANRLADSVKPRIHSISWEELPTFAAPRSVLIRALLLTFCFGVMSYLLFRTFQLPHIPARGSFAGNVTRVSLFAAYSAVVFVSLYVLVNVIDFRQSIVRLRKKSVDNNNRGEFGAVIELAARRSDEIGTTLIYPFVILLIMYIAQLTVFDDWKLNIPLLIIWFVLVGSLFLSAWRMRRESVKLRQKVVQLLNELKAATAGGRSPARNRGLEEMTAAIESESRGAYCAWTDDALLRAVAIPLGGGSGMLLLQQLLLR